MLPLATASAAPTAVAPADLSSVHAAGPVRDAVLREAPARRSAALVPQVFQDLRGLTITLETALGGVDLVPIASLLSAVRHGPEIEDLVVEVVAPSSIESFCGAGALACYLPLEPGASGRGRMWVPSSDPDLAHVVVHEYGHHVDNQQSNLGHLGTDCPIDGDGSRNWFFERDSADDILGRGFGCDLLAPWELQLAELYAEDFSALNGVRGWMLPTIAAPGDSVLTALRDDLDTPFRPRSRRWSQTVRRGRSRSHRLALADWTALTISLRGPRRANLDLVLRGPAGEGVIADSRGRGSSELVEMVVPPGTYTVVVRARRATGRARVVALLD